MKRIYTEEQLLQRRLSGILPTIDIAGDKWTVDWRLKELRLENQIDKTINLDDLALDLNGLNYLCFYHLPTKTVVTIPEDITRLPEDTVMLKIPNEMYLDPVGVAREYGLEDTFLLKQYPIRQDMEALVVPVKESGLPELIKANKERISKEKSQKRLSIVNLLRRRKGKGL